MSANDVNHVSRHRATPRRFRTDGSIADKRETEDLLCK